MIDRQREDELKGHYHDGYKKGRSAAHCKDKMLDQYRKHGYMNEGWADGYRDSCKRVAPVQNHYDTGYRRGKTAAVGNQGEMLMEAQNDGAWREGWVDGYRGLDKRDPGLLCRKSASQ